MYLTPYAKLFTINKTVIEIPIIKFTLDVESVIQSVMPNLQKLEIKN